MWLCGTCACEACTCVRRCAARRRARAQSTLAERAPIRRTGRGGGACEARYGGTWRWGFSERLLGCSAPSNPGVLQEAGLHPEGGSCRGWRRIRHGHRHQSRTSSDPSHRGAYRWHRAHVTGVWVRRGPGGAGRSTGGRPEARGDMLAGGRAHGPAGVRYGSRRGATPANNFACYRAVTPGCSERNAQK